MTATHPHFDFKKIPNRQPVSYRVSYKGTDIGLVVKDGIGWRAFNTREEECGFRHGPGSRLHAAVLLAMDAKLVGADFESQQAALLGEDPMVIKNVTIPVSIPLLVAAPNRSNVVTAAELSEDAPLLVNDPRCPFEVTTRKLADEEEEAAFGAWLKQNTKALVVIYARTVGGSYSVFFKDATEAAETYAKWGKPRPMTHEEFRDLTMGDIVESASGNTFVVTENHGGRVTAVRSVDITNPAEWTLVRKAAPKQT